MTKNFAIPGLRLGYMLGSEELIRRVQTKTFPWSVNALACEVGKFLLQNRQYLLPDITKLFKRKKTFITQMGELPGFTPLSSGTSFFLVHTRYNVHELKRHLLDQHGILIREASNFRNLDEHYFRVNTLSEEKNNMLINALKNYAPHAQP